MKKLILSILLACSAFAAQAMSYEQARAEARFLTDKMAYELNLNDQQYNDCFEINLDYFLSLSTQSDLMYGNYLAYRNADLRHILLDWQWTLFATADYFLNPVSWYRGAWYFPIYHYYTHGHFFYNRPHVFWSYRGGHGRFHYHAGYYSARRPHHWGGGYRGHDRGPVGHRPNGGHTGAGRPGGNRPGYHFENARPDGNGAGHSGNGRPDHNGNNGGYRPGNNGGNHNGTNGGNHNGGTVNTQGRAGYTIGTPSRGGNQPAGFTNPSTSNSNRSGHSSYQHESSTRTTVHSTAGQSSQGRAGSMGSSRGSFSGGSSRSQGSFSGGSSRGGGSSHSGGSSRGGSSRGGSSHGGGRGGR